MKKATKFYAILSIIIAFGLIIRIIPLLNNNFYFTIDQGDDAIHVREILRGSIMLHGPETNIRGFFAGPLWYYFISVGYFLFDGHPFGAIFMLILLNLTLTATLVIVLRKKVSATHALIVGTVLQTFWWFYDTSRYAFNPFPNVFLSFSTLLLLACFLEGRKKYFLLAALPVGLSMHFEPAYSVGLMLFYFLFSLWAMVKRKISLKYFIIGITILILLQTPQIIFEVQNDFFQFHNLVNHLNSENSVFQKTQFPEITNAFMVIISRASTGQNKIIGVLLYLAITGIFFKMEKAKKLQWKNYFILLSFALVFVLWFWFSLTLGWRKWHTNPVHSILFVALLLMLLSFPQKVKLALLALVFLLQINIFSTRYKDYLTASDDPAILKNSLSTLDWVYDNAEKRGFSVYTYEPTVYDTVSQYLFWWYGKKTYGYLPCEYSTYPNSPETFVPGWEFYQKPIKPCHNLRFLVMYPDQNGMIDSVWYQGVSRNTNLEKSETRGKIKLEKRITY